MTEKMVTVLDSILKAVMLFAIGVAIMFSIFGIAVYAGNKKTDVIPHHYTDQEILEMALKNSDTCEGGCFE